MGGNPLKGLPEGDLRKLAESNEKQDTPERQASADQLKAEAKEALGD